MPKLKVAVVGLGFIATKRHLPIWRQIGDADTAIVCDVNQEAVDQAMHTFRVPIGATDMLEVIEEVRPDIVDLCTPPSTHLTLAQQAMEAGCHVIMEKPMAFTSQDCRDLVDCSIATGKKLCVIHNWLFYPPVLRAVELIHRGAIGRLLGLELFLSNPSTEYLCTDNWVHRLPGGLMGETGPHIAYLSSAFVGNIKQVRVNRTKLSSFPWAQADDFHIRLEGELAPASIRVVYNSNFWAADLDIWGTEGRLKIDLEAMTLHQFSRSNLKPLTLGASVLRELTGNGVELAKNFLGIATGRFTRGHQKIMEAFVNSVLQDTEPPVSSQSAMESVALLEEIVRQLEASTTTQTNAHDSRPIFQANVK